MTFNYQEAVPWGRSFDEYLRMFSLTDSDLDGSILGCADGPASFNAGSLARGHHVISCDPLYAVTTDQIEVKIAATFDDVITQTRENEELFVWDLIESPDHLGRIRSQAMRDFLADFDQTTGAGRYVAGELPFLPFRSGSFDLALSSHFLFLYSSQLSRDFHKLAVAELCRVAREVRIFPLLTHDAQPSPHVEAVIEHLESLNHTVVIERVTYEFQRGGNEMMRVLRGRA